MHLIKALYQGVEKTLFNSLLRKLLGCMVPIWQRGQACLVLLVLGPIRFSLPIR